MRLALGSTGAGGAPEFHEAGSAPRALSLGTPLSILKTGRSKPLLFQLRDEQGQEAGLWVVKAQCRSTYRHKLVLHELAGAELCAWFGLNTPATGTLRLPTIPLGTDSTDVGIVAAEIYATDAGKLAFCSRYIHETYVTDGVLSLQRRRSQSIIADGIRLLSLDATTWHHDRCSGSPNAFLVRKRIVPFDNERAFYDIEGIQSDGTSIAYSEPIDSTATGEHIAAELAAKNQGSPEWEAFTERLRALSDSDIDSMVRRLPDELDMSPSGSWKKDFRRFLVRRRDCVVSIVNEVRRVLSTR